MRGFASNNRRMVALFLLILLISALAQTASLKELSREDWRTPDNSKLAAHLTLRRDAHELFKRKAAQSEEPLEEEVLFCDSVRETIGLLESETQSQILVHTRVENEDVIIFINSTNEMRKPIKAETYTNFMILSHLPVTAITILLPDLLQNDFMLPGTFSESNTYERMKRFQKHLKQLDMATITSNVQRNTAMQIVMKVSTFVNDTLFDPSTVNKESIQAFTGGLMPALTDAARFAEKGYFETLDSIIATIRSDLSEWSVIIAVDGFSYPGSFLVQYYEQLLNTTFGKDAYFSPERIVLMPQPVCNTSGLTTNTNVAMEFAVFRMALSNATYIRTINKLFSNGSELHPLHSFLSDVAREIFTHESLAFRGFETLEERLYVILIVTLLSTTVVFLVVFLSVYCEDKLIKMENKPVKVKMKVSNEPSLLTPFAEKELASSYSAFHQLRKKHIRSVYKQETKKPEVDKQARCLVPSTFRCQILAASPLNASEGSHSNNNIATHSDITLADLTES